MPNYIGIEGITWDKLYMKEFWDFMDSLISCMWILCKEILRNVLEFKRILNYKNWIKWEYCNNWVKN
jgi:hypothetical protein